MLTNNASRPVVYFAIELSASSWVVACRQPMNEKIKTHRMEAGDCGAEVGFDRHYVKPIDVADIEEILMLGDRG